MAQPLESPSDSAWHPGCTRDKASDAQRRAPDEALQPPTFKETHMGFGIDDLEKMVSNPMGMIDEVMGGSSGSGTDKSGGSNSSPLGGLSSMIDPLNLFGTIGNMVQQISGGGGGGGGGGGDSDGTVEDSSDTQPIDGDGDGYADGDDSVNRGDDDPAETDPTAGDDPDTDYENNGSGTDGTDGTGSGGAGDVNDVDPSGNDPTGDGNDWNTPTTHDFAGMSPEQIVEELLGEMEGKLDDKMDAKTEELQKAEDGGASKSDIDKLTRELQQIMEQRSAMFNLLSNMEKAENDMSMTAINNMGKL
jgi:hypothetical protein